MKRIGSGIGALVLALAALAPAGAQTRPLAARANVPMAAGPAALEQPARLTVENLPLEQALIRLYESSGVPVSFSPTRIPDDLRVSCDCGTVGVKEALDRLLHRTLFRYREMEGHILVFDALPERERHPLAPRTQYAALGRLEEVFPTTPQRAIAAIITGRVTDASTGQPVPGAQVTVVNTRLGAVAGPDGRYTITGVPAGAHRVRASMIGYVAEEQRATLTDGRSTSVNFALQAQALALEGVVAVGYGTARRRDVTGSIATISGEELATRAAPTSSVANSLQGRAPGVQVVTNSGMPGAGASVRIRGTNSITANSEPLYVIDGIPAAQGTASRDPTENPLNTINPNDIERIEILKDASATAIYGARGANGVVLVTTRRGTRGEDRVVLESSYGIQEVSNTIDVLSARQYRELRNEALANIGSKPQFSQQQIAAAQTTDYPGLLLRTAPQQSHTLTVSGGDAKTRYLVSGNLMEQEGIIRGTEFGRYAGRLNLDRDVSDRFRIGTSLSLARAKTDLSEVEAGGAGGNSRGILAGMLYDPALPVRDENGNYVRRAVMAEFLVNPIATVNELVDRRNETRFIGNLFGEYDLAAGLRFRSSLGANVWDAFNPYYAPTFIDQGFTRQGEARIGQGRSTELLNENLLSYRREAAGPGSLDLTGGFTVQTSRFDGTRMRGFGFQTDQTGYNAIGAGSVRPEVWSEAVEWTLLSYLGRANYNLLDRYLFTVTGRYDGSSRFGANNKWAFFPSAAFAWRMLEEPFLRDQGLFSDLKLRLSYGRTGNQAVDPYNSLAQLAPMSSAIGGTNAVGFAPRDVAPNPDLKWETTQQFNAGVDAGFLDNRVRLSLDAYRSRTDDLLLEVNTPFVSGFRRQLQNIGVVENTGVELALNTINLESERFSWRSTLNLAANRNEVSSLGDGREFIFPDGSWSVAGGSHIIQPGEPLGAFYGYRVNGLWQPGDACDLQAPRKTLDCVPGEMRIADVNGDGKITPDDRTIIGYADPAFYGGFANNLAFGAFTLEAFMNFSYGNEIINGGNAFLMNSTGAFNERVEVLNRWTPQNTNATIPRANASRRAQVSSLLVEDGSFLRLQTLTLGYQLPSGLLGGRAQATRLYLTGQNLWTLTDYSGFDPEVNRYGGDPRLRGLDVGAYPRARTWNVGVNVTF